MFGTIKGTPAREPLNHALYDENAQNESLCMMRLPRPLTKLGGRTAASGLYGIFKVLTLWAMRMPKRKSVPVSPMKVKKK